jgi:catechol 2,3-dioxygenase-like lactoylglutathione lyase family enzyme
MTSRLSAICFRTPRPDDLVRFWSGVLPDRAPDGTDLLPPAGTEGFRVRFVPGDEPKSGQNRAHFDLTSGTDDAQRDTVARVLALGGRHIDIGQRPEETHVVLADPDGNELCVIAAGNKFLAGTGDIGALSCDGTQAVGYFWSAALGWPLVWDQDEETAIQAPSGGTKITWGGPPVAPKHGVNRVHLELAASGDEETDRLVSLGATRTGTPGLLLDPDGNEFTVRLTS